MQIKRLACKPYSKQGQCLHRQLLLLKKPAGRICRHHLHITEGQQLGAQLLGLDSCNAACQRCTSNSYHVSGCMVFKWKFGRPAVASKSCMCCLPAPLSTDAPVKPRSICGRACFSAWALLMSTACAGAQAVTRGMGPFIPSHLVRSCRQFSASALAVIAQRRLDAVTGKLGL